MSFLRRLFYLRNQISAATLTLADDVVQVLNLAGRRSFKAPFNTTGVLLTSNLFRMRFFFFSFFLKICVSCYFIAWSTKSDSLAISSQNKGIFFIMLFICFLKKSWLGSLTHTHFPMKIYYHSNNLEDLNDKQRMTVSSSSEPECN